MARLKIGRHPDTDRHFWDGYVDAPQLKVRAPWVWEKPWFWAQVEFGIGSCLVIALVVFLPRYVRKWRGM
jgi:hypothetical protein